MTRDQKDLVEAIATVSRQIADYVALRFEAGATMDDVQAQFRRAADTVDGWRIGRGV